MKNLNEYLQALLEEEGGGDMGGGAGMSTPANTMGMGNVSPESEPILAVPGGIPKTKTKIYRRRRKKKKDSRDFIMTDDIHKV